MLRILSLAAGLAITVPAFATSVTFEKLSGIDPNWGPNLVATSAYFCWDLGKRVKPDEDSPDETIFHCFGDAEHRANIWWNGSNHFRWQPADPGTVLYPCVTDWDGFQDPPHDQRKRYVVICDLRNAADEPAKEYKTTILFNWP